MYRNRARKRKHPIFDCVKKFLRLFKKKPKFIYLGEKVNEPSLILSNHVGSSGPLTWELYPEFPFRFWGTYEMNSSLPTLYKYLSKDYFHGKMHWPLWISRIFCVIAGPIVYCFYKGLELISTYPDARLKKTINTSIEVIEDGNNIIIFPEDSSVGYFDKLTKFFSGFLVLAERCFRRGKDLPIFIAYFSKKDKKVVIDRPIRYSELLSKYNGLSSDEIAAILLTRSNQLGVDIRNKVY
jgi:hypothetical protein